MTDPDSLPPLLRLERIACPLCGGSDTAVVVRAGDPQWGVPGTFQVERCQSCGHLFLNPRPIVEDLARCYPQDYGPHRPPAETARCAAAKSGKTVSQTPWYLRYLPLRFVPGLKKLYLWLLEDLSQPVPQPITADTQPRALELGCATGSYLLQLRQLGWQVTGVEPAAGPVQVARARGLQVHHGSLESFPVDGDSFDLAVAWMVLEHVPDPRHTLTTLHRLLRPGGQLMFSVPNAGCWEPGWFGPDWDAWDLPRHLHHFSPQTIRRLLHECGFEAVQIQHQRTLLNVVGSLGVRFTRRNPDSRPGRWLQRYPHSPRLWTQLLLAPIAHALAFVRQGGRLTVFARRPGDPARD